MESDECGEGGDEENGGWGLEVEECRGGIMGGHGGWTEGEEGRDNGVGSLG